MEHSRVWPPTADCSTQAPVAVCSVERLNLLRATGSSFGTDSVGLKSAVPMCHKGILSKACLFSCAVLDIAAGHLQLVEPIATMCSDLWQQYLFLHRSVSPSPARHHKML